MGLPLAVVKVLLPSIIRNTRISPNMIWKAMGLALVITLYARYLLGPINDWFIGVFQDFTSVNIFAALAGSQYDIVKSLPMILAWTIISLVCYFLYIFMDYLWGMVKLIVPTEISVIEKKNDIFDNLFLLNVLIRIGIVAAIVSLIPLAIFLIQPISAHVASLVQPLLSDPVYQEVWVNVAVFPIWLLYSLLFFYVLAMIAYERGEIAIDEEHNPLLNDDDDTEDSDDTEE